MLLSVAAAVRITGGPNSLGIRIIRESEDETSSEAPNRHVEQLTCSNIITLNALVELLTEKGVLSKSDIL